MFSLRHSGNPWQDWLQLGLHCRHIATDTGPGAPALVWSGQLTTQSCKHQLCNRIARNYGNFLEMWNRHYFGHELKLSFLWQWSEMSSNQFPNMYHIVRTIVTVLKKARLPVPGETYGLCLKLTFKTLVIAKKMDGCEGFLRRSNVTKKVIFLCQVLFYQKGPLHS